MSKIESKQMPKIVAKNEIHFFMSNGGGSGTTSIASTFAQLVGAKIIDLDLFRQRLLDFGMLERVPLEYPKKGSIVNCETTDEFLHQAFGKIFDIKNAEDANGRCIVVDIPVGAIPMVLGFFSGPLGKSLVSEYRSRGGTVYAHYIVNSENLRWSFWGAPGAGGLLSSAGIYFRLWFNEFRRTLLREEDILVGAKKTKKGKSSAPDESRLPEQYMKASKVLEERLEEMYLGYMIVPFSNPSQRSIVQGMFFEKRIPIANLFRGDGNIESLGLMERSFAYAYFDEFARRMFEYGVITESEKEEAEETAEEAEEQPVSSTEERDGDSSAAAEEKREEGDQGKDGGEKGDDEEVEYAY